jgi:hypothetical protein
MMRRVHHHLVFERIRCHQAWEIHYLWRPRLRHQRPETRIARLRGRNLQSRKRSSENGFRRFGEPGGPQRIMGLVETLDR